MDLSNLDAMTNEELLQQAKDEVAKEHPKKFKDWHDMMVNTGPGLNWEKYTDRAGVLAIQRAREEATPKWIPVATLPESGRHVLLHCKGEGNIMPSGKPKTFICTGFYTEARKTECWIDDYDPKTCTGIEDFEECLYLAPGFYAEHEQHRGDTDYHFFPREVIEWMPLPEIKN